MNLQHSATTKKKSDNVYSRDFNPETDSGWLWTGDNLEVMYGLEDEIVDLIYLDPPFNSKESNVDIFKTVDQEVKLHFKDIWKPTEKDEYILKKIGEYSANLFNYINSVGDMVDMRMRSYLIFMGIRLIEMHRILKSTGSIYLHCDMSASHYLKGLLDGIFGRDNLRNEIVWCYTGPGSPKMRQFNRKHDTIFWYSKGEKWTFNDDDIRIKYKHGKPQV